MGVPNAQSPSFVSPAPSSNSSHRTLAAAARTAGPIDVAQVPAALEGVSLRLDGASESYRAAPG